MSKSAIELLLEQRPGIKSVVMTRRTIILWFDDGFKVNIEADQYTTDSGFASSRLDVDIISPKPEVIASTPLALNYEIQVWSNNRWKSESRAFEDQTTATGDAQNISTCKHTQVRVLDLRSQKIVAYIDDGTIMRQVQATEGKKLEYMIEWCDEQGIWHDLHKSFAIVTAAHHQAKGLSKDLRCRTRVISRSNGSVWKVYSNGMIEYNMAPPYTIQCRVASDEPWTNIDDQNYDDLDEAREKAKELSKNAMAYGMVAVVESSTGRRVALFSGGTEHH